MADDTTFDACTDAASVEAILNTYTLEDETVTKIGVQNGTTGQFYVQATPTGALPASASSASDTRTARSRFRI